MNAKRALVVGASAPDTVKLIEAINRAGQAAIIIEGFLDDDAAKQGTAFMGYPVIGPVSMLETQRSDAGIVNNVARDMKTRQSVVRRLGKANVSRYLTLIHPSVDASNCKVGHGCIIQEGVVLGCECEVGDHCVLYAKCVIGHESRVGDLVFVANNAIVGARTKIGTGSFVGLNSVVLPYLEIGPWATIGAGSVVLKNVASASAVFGNPARAGVQPTHLTAEAS